MPRYAIQLDTGRDLEHNARRKELWLAFTALNCAINDGKTGLGMAVYQRNLRRAAKKAGIVGDSERNITIHDVYDRVEAVLSD